MKDYQACINWLYSQLPLFQKNGKAAYHPGLENIKSLLKGLGNPEANLKAIHVAGTNGKGSVSHMLASILQEAGLKVGLYTSPHLKKFEERVKINGEPISQNHVIEFTHKMMKSPIKPSFFEMTVALAFDTFRNEQVDISIIETGMGGRLDSTNVIQPLLSVITNIGLDHQQYLGNTLALIAQEKAGIIKPFTPVVIGKKQKETTDVFVNTALQKKAELIWSEDFECQYETDLKGHYQIENKRTAFAAIQILNSKLFKINETSIKKGLIRTISNTGLQGRYQILSNSPKVIADTGHNEDALKWLIPQLLKESFDKLHMVIGMANDKDSHHILQHMPTNAQYYFCKPDVPRGKDVTLLFQEARAFDLKGSPYNTVLEALAAAKSNAKKDDLIFVGGSTFVVAEVV
jgi:dihydrofolate synthase/folylpolyglutamate synthase